MIKKCDICDIGTLIQPKSVDLIIFDPPYGIGNSKLSHKEKKWHKSSQDWDTFKSVDEQHQFYLTNLNILLPLINVTGSMFVFGSFHSIFLIGEILQRCVHVEAKIINSIVWNKVNAMFSVARRSLIEGTEYIIWVTPSENKYYFNYEYSCSVNYNTQLRNVWESSKTPNTELRGHPHQKPLWLIHRLVRLACPNDGFVLDPMCGSGTTEVVCCGEHIDSLCTDINEDYLKIAQARWREKKNTDMYSRDANLK